MGLPFVVQKVKQDKNYRTGFWFDCIWKMSRDIWEAKSPGAMTCFTYSCPKTYYRKLLSSFTDHQLSGKWAISNPVSLNLHPQIFHSSSTKRCVPEWTCGKDKNSTILHVLPHLMKLLPFCLCSEKSPSISCVPCMWKERPAPCTHFLTPETLEVPGCGWELEDMLTYALPDSGLSEDRGASSP